MISSFTLYVMIDLINVEGFVVEAGFLKVNLSRYMNNTCTADQWIHEKILYLTCLFVPSRSKWHRSWKTHTQSRWQDCTLNTRLNMTCWKTWGMNTSASHACTNTILKNTLANCQMILILVVMWPWYVHVCTACTHGHSHAQKERRKETTNGLGRIGIRKKKRRRIVIFQFFEKAKGSGKRRRNFLLPSSCSPTLSFFLSFFFSKFHFVSRCHILHAVSVSFLLWLFFSLSTYFSFFI